jgi:hypothetical protein
MIVNLIRVLIKTPESVDLVVAAVSDRSVHQTSRPLSQSSGNFWMVAISAQRAALDRGIGHEEGIVRGDCGRGSNDGRKLVVGVGSAGALSEDRVGATSGS